MMKRQQSSQPRARKASACCETYGRSNEGRCSWRCCYLLLLCGRHDDHAVDHNRWQYMFFFSTLRAKDGMSYALRLSVGNRAAVSGSVCAVQCRQRYALEGNREEDIAHAARRERAASPPPSRARRCRRNACRVR